MNIVKATPEVLANKYLAYRLTMSGEGENLSNHVGEIFDVAEFVLYDRVNSETGETTRAFSMLTPEDEIYGSGSAAFCDTFEKIILGIFEPNEVKRIKVIAKTSKAGREYIQPVCME